MSATLNDLSRLCVHTITTKPWDIETAAKRYASEGVRGITVWRDALHGRNLRQTGRMLNDCGLQIVSLCRGGFFPNTDKAKRSAALDDNRKAIEEAAELGAPMIVLVCGSDPGQPLAESRKQIKEGIIEILPQAASANIKLAIEPLHPMYADSRSAINTLGQANDMAEALNSPFVGVAIDVYHVWWDPFLEKEIRRCGEKDHLFAFHICDWNVPTQDLLWDRGLMGEGCIPVATIRSWVESTGFSGFYEVEIFSDKFWKEDQTSYLRKIVHAYRSNS